MSVSQMPPSRSAAKPLSQCLTLDEAFKSQQLIEIIKSGLPKHITPDRMLRAWIQAVNKQPDLKLCDWRQVIGACLSLSHIGLEPNTPLNHAYLIPFRTKIWNPETRKRDKEIVDLNIVIGYPGMADLLWRSGLVTNIHADVVLPGDEFEHEHGTFAKLVHKPRGKALPRDEPTWAYAHVHIAVGQGSGQAFHAMPWHDVLAIRDTSQAYQSALAAKLRAEEKGWNLPRAWTDTPWNRNIREMGKKTPFRALQKYLSRSAEVAYAVDLEDRQDQAGSLDFSHVIEGTPDDIEDKPEEQRPQVEHQQYVDPLAAHGERRREEAPATLDGQREQPRQAPQQARQPPQDEPPPGWWDGQAGPTPRQQAPEPRQQAPEHGRGAQEPQAQEQKRTPAARQGRRWDLYDHNGDVYAILDDVDAWIDAFDDIAREVPVDRTEDFASYNRETIDAAAAEAPAYAVSLRNGGWLIEPTPRAQIEDQRQSPAQEQGQKPDAAPQAQQAKPPQEQRHGAAPVGSLFGPSDWPQVPRTRSGKIDEKAAREILESAIAPATTAAEIDRVVADIPPDWRSAGAAIQLLIMRARAARRMALNIPAEEGNDDDATDRRTGS